VREGESSRAARFQARVSERESAQNLASSHATEPKAHGAHSFLIPTARRSLREHEIRSGGCDSISHSSRCESFATEDYSTHTQTHIYKPQGYIERFMKFQDDKE